MTLDQVLIRFLGHGYDDTNEQGFRVYSLHTPGWDEWIQTKGTRWEHRKDEQQLGQGRVLASGKGATSLRRYLAATFKEQDELNKWYRANPDDAREHDADDIARRFQVPQEPAQAMFERIQRDAYGP